MRVGMMTTWGSPCGIATYSEQLVPALKDKGIGTVIMAPADPSSKTCIRPDTPAARVELCWDKKVIGSSALSTDVVKAYELDLVHVQHEDGLFLAPKDYVLDLFTSLGCPVCVTLHTVQHNRPGWYRRLLSTPDIHVIVHTPAAWAYLSSFGCGRVSLVRHGTPASVEGNRDKGLALLKQPRDDDATTGLVFGFVNVGKCIEHTLQLYIDARETRYIAGASRLFIVGAPSSTPAEAYMQSLEGYVKQMGYEHEVFIMPMFVDVKDVPHVFAAADLGILNSNSASFSASGQVHQAAAQGLPLVVSNSPIYVEAVQASCPSFDNEGGDATRLIGGMFNSAALRKLVSLRMKALASATSWDKLAAVYAGLYADTIA